MARWLTLFGVLALAAIVAVGVLQYARHYGTGSIEGTITTNGQPLKGGFIRFFSHNTEVEARVQKNGTFMADEVPVGEYVVTLESPDVPCNTLRRRSRV